VVLELDLFGLRLTRLDQLLAALLPNDEPASLVDPACHVLDPRDVLENVPHQEIGTVLSTSQKGHSQRFYVRILSSQLDCWQDQCKSK
jgi:hypothetical protein